ncbi:HAMP domain-containing histidine kinase [Mycobacterium sp. MYCO198283]|uniref:sensor histidine kinase n=1 Tax=Mycobacterium sp. MYCO198283 TaxID=2883505 RepID=UPI001E48BDE3|nr:HAMP domain-containing sensor histidine kinase [Mycobacterium sp. MYCO198283]MCG5433323.1 HAMP domain-containing histidine kinase [Mycobacterium sp. MYCO198283]
MVAASVVLVAYGLAAAGLALILYRSLLSGVDDAAAARVQDVVAGLRFDPVPELDAALLTTDQRIVAVQVLDSAGTVVRRSPTAPAVPLVDPTSLGEVLRVGLPDRFAGDGDIRVGGQTVSTATGRYTVLVGAGSEAVESTVKTVVVLLAGAAPIIALVSAAVTYGLVRRSLLSVDAIRARVAAISTSDLTERVPVPSSRDEISALATTMNAMLARIEAGHAAQRRFVGDASHELRSPVAAILSALDVAAAHPELLDEHLAASTLRREAQRMQSLVEDLLLLARADEHGLTPRRIDVDLDDIAFQEAGRLQRETTLKVDAELQPARIIGDPNDVARVVRNLLDNAARHAAALVELRVLVDGSDAVLTVGDDGPGIPAADRTRVFGRFVRLDSDRSRRGGGTGLGLAIVAEVVAAHGGHVVLGDRVGGGTLVRVQFPLGSVESNR